MFHINNRPLVFSDVIGQTVAKTVLSRISSQELQDTSFLLAGPHGVGKTTLGRVFARALLCPHVLPSGDPCNSCRSCRAHLTDTHTGYIEIDAANHGDKADIAALLAGLSFESESGRVVILIDECQGISRAGKDALLKVLETRSDGSVVFIFCTTELHKVPPALVSRSLAPPVRALTTMEVFTRLKSVAEAEGLRYEDKALLLIADACGGHVRDAEQSLRLAFLSSSDGIVGEEAVANAGVVSRSVIGKALSMLPRDPAGTLAIVDECAGRAGARAVYDTMLSILVEAARHGLSLGKYEASPAAIELYNSFPRKIQAVIDYLLSRNTLSDTNMLRADILVMHARYLLGDIYDTAAGVSPPTTQAAGVTGKSAAPGAQPAAQASAVSSKNKSGYSDPLAAALATRAMKSRERQERLGAVDSPMKESAMPGAPVERTSAVPFTLGR